ncbi:MAG: cob(I)yrinic acid a,c-diamide adenosyltransferase [Candidatus Nitrosocaldaceae archaeon]
MSLVIVYTGNGKGKTTAALGIALRAVAYNYKICMIQFIKGSWSYGEMKSFERLKPEFELVIAGKGFVGIIDDDKSIDEHRSAARNALEISKEKILSQNYDIIILDEINYAIKLGLIEVKDVISLINKRGDTHIVLTGNYAHEEIINIADLVTEMREIKHPYKRGIKAVKGIDY